MRLPFSKPLDPLAERYREVTPKRISRGTPLSGIPFLVLDAETSGFKIGSDTLLSLAAMELRDGRALAGKTAAWIVYRDRAPVTAASEVHGILPSESARGLPEKEVLAALLPMIGGKVIVGHHIGFDAAMIDSALRRHYGIGLRNPLIDTAIMAMGEVDAFRRTGYANQRPPGLDEVCAHLGLPTMERHTAEGDTLTTAQLFLLLCGRLRRRLQREPRAADLPIATGGSFR